MHRAGIAPLARHHGRRESVTGSGKALLTYHGGFGIKSEDGTKLIGDACDPNAAFIDPAAEGFDDAHLGPYPGTFAFEGVISAADSAQGYINFFNTGDTAHWLGYNADPSATSTHDVDTQHLTGVATKGTTTCSKLPDGTVAPPGTVILSGPATEMDLFGGEVVYYDPATPPSLDTFTLWVYPADKHGVREFRLRWCQMAGVFYGTVKNGSVQIR